MANINVGTASITTTLTARYRYEAASRTTEASAAARPHESRTVWYKDHTRTDEHNNTRRRP